MKETKKPICGFGAQNMLKHLFRRPLRNVACTTHMTVVFPTIKALLLFFISAHFFFTQGSLNKELLSLSGFSVRGWGSAAVFVGLTGPWQGPSPVGTNVRLCLLFWPPTIKTWLTVSYLPACECNTWQWFGVCAGLSTSPK